MSKCKEAIRCDIIHLDECVGDVVKLNNGRCYLVVKEANNDYGLIAVDFQHTQRHINTFDYTVEAVYSSKNAKLKKVLVKEDD